jgi:hypothetical protein
VSAHTEHAEDALQPTTFTTPGNIRGLALGLLVVGGALLGYAISSEAWRGWSAGLLASYYFLSIALGASVVVAIMHVTKAGWGVVIRRVPEAIMGYLPVALLTMLTFCGLGMQSLYEWSHPDIVAEDHLLQHKQVLLNPTGFLVRMVIIIGGWSLFTFFIRKRSVAQDADGDLKYTNRNLTFSVLYIIFMGLTLTFGALDWLMSLEPHWFSTMFGVYQFAGAHAAGVATIILFTIALKNAGFLPHVTTEHLHDLGKFLFGLATFWAYIWIGQFLLIWYANIPEETGYFIIRQDGGWLALWLGNVLINWTIPFFVLLPRPNKRNPKILVAMSILVLCGHWLDVYLQVMPATSHFAAEMKTLTSGHGPYFGAAEIGATAALAGLFLLTVTTVLGRASLLPSKDPYLTESLHHHQ